jgi:hypothetical protein
VNQIDNRNAAATERLAYAIRARTPQPCVCGRDAENAVAIVTADDLIAEVYWTCDADLADAEHLAGIAASRPGDRERVLVVDIRPEDADLAALKARYGIARTP